MTGQEGAILLAGFTVAGVVVAHWRLALATLATGALGLMIIGAVQVAQWLHALS